MIRVGVVPANKVLFAETVPANNLFVYFWWFAIGTPPIRNILSASIYNQIYEINHEINEELKNEEYICLEVL